MLSVLCANGFDRCDVWVSGRETGLLDHHDGSETSKRDSAAPATATGWPRSRRAACQVGRAMLRAIAWPGLYLDPDAVHWMVGDMVRMETERGRRRWRPRSVRAPVAGGGVMAECLS